MALLNVSELQIDSQDKTKVYTLDFGYATINVHERGAINTLSSKDKPITAQRDPATTLPNLRTIANQRGGNPFMAPMAGRYGDEDDENLQPQRIAQPGPVDIHGVFAALTWNVNKVDEDNNYIELVLPASKWKKEIKDYYFFASQGNNSADQKSLERLLRATNRRFPNNAEIHQRMTSLTNYLNGKGLDNAFGTIVDQIDRLVDIAYAGEPDIYRRITLDDTQGENFQIFRDEVWINNTSKTDEFRDASGYHTYFNALLSEIVNPPWNKSNVPSDFDDNLDNLRVAEFNQVQRLNRHMFVVPIGELQVPTANSIIYKDPITARSNGKAEIPEVAYEYWRQRGDDVSYPEKARVIKPTETSYVGIEIIVVNDSEVPKNILNYISEVNAKLEA